MSNWITLNTSRGDIKAWQAMPNTTPRAGLIVIQEIFGVNAHIRSVAESYAEQGYAVLAPAVFDPIEKDVELGYGPEGFAKGLDIIEKLGLDAALEIVNNAAQVLAPYGKIGTVGYCWGGTVAMLAAIRLGLPSVNYYGGFSTPYLEETPKAPVVFHFGEKDTHITPDVVELHHKLMPQMPIFTYPTGHAFNRDVDPNAYDAVSAKLALQRTLNFFNQHLE